MVYLTQKNIELIRAVLYLLRKNFTLTTYKKRNLVRILNALLDENTLLSHPTMSEKENKKVIKNYCISPLFSMTILKEEKEWEKLDEDKGCKKLILYNKVEELEKDIYEVREKDISPGKCLAIERIPGTISHEVKIINSKRKLEQKLPWKYEGRKSIILPPIKLFDWNNVESNNQHNLLTVNEQQPKIDSQPSNSVCERERLERDLPNEGKVVLNISTQKENTQIELFNWNFKDKKEKRADRRNKNKNKRKLRKERRIKKKKKNQGKFDKLEYLKQKQKIIDEKIQKKYMIESSIQTKIALNDEKIKEKKELNKSLEEKSNEIRARVKENKRIKKENYDILNDDKRLLKDYKNYGYKVACRRQTRRLNQKRKSARKCDYGLESYTFKYPDIKRPKRELTEIPTFQVNKLDDKKIFNLLYSH